MYKPFTAVLIIPTGVGASIGGFAGDAMPLLSLFGDVCDTLITHPNVANAAVFQQLPHNALYVEGLALDRVMQGQWHLQPVRQNKVGVVFDAGISDEMMTLHLNTINAVKTTYGVNVIGHCVTPVPLNLQLQKAPSGRSAGQLLNAPVLLEACQTLLDQGATALALCCKLPQVDQDDDEAYCLNGGVDPISGLEALLSHTVVEYFKVPCAHAPVFDWDEAKPELTQVVDARVAAESITPTFLPCVLQGLAKSPQIVEAPQKNTIGVDDVDCVIVPADCLGSIPVLAALAKNITIITVAENKTVMQATAAALEGLQAQVIHCNSYLEAVGVCVALKKGLQLSQHLMPKGGSKAYNSLTTIVENSACVQ